MVREHIKNGSGDTLYAMTGYTNIGEAVDLHIFSRNKIDAMQSACKYDPTITWSDYIMPVVTNEFGVLVADLSVNGLE